MCVFSADSFRLAEEDRGLVEAFGRFLATNIVGTVAVLVFVVFFFPSLALHFLVSGSEGEGKRGRMGGRGGEGRGRVGRGGKGEGGEGSPLTHVPLLCLSTV